MGLYHRTLTIVSISFSFSQKICNFEEFRISIEICNKRLIYKLECSKIMYENIINKTNKYFYGKEYRNNERCYFSVRCDFKLLVFFTFITVTKIQKKIKCKRIKNLKLHAN